MTDATKRMEGAGHVFRTYAPGITAIGRTAAACAFAAVSIATAGLAAPADAGVPTEVQPAMGAPLPDLSPELMDRFLKGRVRYEQNWSAEEGLGPIFNQTSCASCHNNPVGGTGSQTVTRFGFAGKKGGFDPLTELGGSLRQANGLSAECEEFVPAVANVVSERVTNGALAYGLVEAVADQTLLDIRDAQPASQRGIAHIVTHFEDPDQLPHVGRFGWKAQLASVLSFSADASGNELGITNMFLTEEQAPNGDLDTLADCDLVADPEDTLDDENFFFIERVTDFQRLLAPAPQTPRSGMAGEVIFNDIGCAVCHTPAMTTGNDPSLPAVLHGQDIRPYGDFLLHDMGLGSDGIVQGMGTERLIKTPPLWGLRTRDPMWHDGRFVAGTFETRLDEVMAEHGAFGSQAMPSSDAYAALDPADHDAIVRFLGSLGQHEFDADDDRRVLLADFYGPNGFVECYGTAPTPDDDCAIHDIDQDTDVDLDDFASFLTVYAGLVEDCNDNGVTDLQDILVGDAIDANMDGRIDLCETCLGDVDGSGAVEIGDMLAVLDQWGPCPMSCPADVDQNGTVDVSDLLTVLAEWGPCQ